MHLYMLVSVLQVLDEKETTVYKRAVEAQYQLKMKASRAVLSEINSQYPSMPFTMRALLSTDGLKDGLKPSELRLGMVECLNHGLLHPYPVLHEKVRRHACVHAMSMHEKVPAVCICAVGFDGG